MPPKPRASSRQLLAKAAAAAAAAVAVPHEERQVSDSDDIEVSQLSAKKSTSPNKQPTLKIMTSSKLRTPIIETVTKSKVTGTDMLNLVEQFLLQEIGEDTTNRSIPADVKSALTIMCTTRISVWWT